MVTVLFFIFLLTWCVLFAKLEAEVEGEHGWAAKMPTKHWHWEGDNLTFKDFGSDEWVELDKNTRFSRFIIFYIGTLGGKDFTIYHRTVDLIQLFVAHILVYLFFFHTANPAWLEMRVVGTLFLIWTIEDTLWFYVNPLAYKSNHHKDWVKIGKVQLMEKGMFGGFIIGIVLSTISFFGPSFGTWLMPFLNRIF